MEEDPDIDIEENTLMYPRIENIYSDVNIKTEPIDVDDEYDTIEIGESSRDYYMPIPNKIILGSKPSTLVQLESKPGPSTASDNWEDQENFFECAECDLLFPTQNELDSHKMASHSFLVARPMSRTIKSERRISISSTSSRSFLENTGPPEETTRRQKAVKSTAKSALNKTFPVLHDGLKSNHAYAVINPVAISQKKDTADKGDRLLCKHCDIRFPDDIALIKHTYELLPDTKFKCELCQMSFDTQPALRGHMKKHVKSTIDLVPSKNSDILLQCVYCTCFLMYPGFMRKHLWKNHKVSEFAVKHVKFSGKCAICSKIVSNHKLYNKHLLKYHRKVFTSKTRFYFDSTPVKMKCMLCFQIFTSRYTAYKHKAEKHPEQTQKHTFHTVYDKPIKQLPANLPANRPTSPPHPEALKSKLQTSKNSLVDKTYIPKHNLFKCNKCQIHFVSCLAAFAHSKRCSLARGDWKCDKCRRTFTKAEKFLHMQQHQFSEKFKVHIVCDKILSKLLCRCPKCELLFDEISFAEHVSADCVPKNGVECKCCDLRIHLDSYAKHKRYHSKYNFSSSDFIIIDFVDASLQTASVKEEKKGQYKQRLVFCSICKCHFYRVKPQENYHLQGKCETLSKKCCTICGLTFSRKPYINHINYDHRTLNLTLSEIRFVRLEDLKAMNPVMPDFFHCEQCKVRFISPVSKTTHNCSKQVFVKCSMCSLKFDSVTYDIHMTFHNYCLKTENIQASSTELKLYSCVACNYGFHSYDSVVEHCQKHYTNTQDLVTVPCKVCKLKYAEPHRTVHANRPNFEILKFHYEKLLSDDWLTGFGSTSKDIVEDILSKSLYGVMRNVRLEFLVEGPAERTIYKCAQCAINFDQDAVVEHTTESCSSSSPRLACSSCTAAFRTKAAKSNHMNVHVIYGDDITFREILFNNEYDKELNEVLRTGRQKESLKFRKCQQCKLLIKTSNYEAHISTHESKAEIQQFTFRRTKKRLTYKLFKPANAGKKLYTVYKCKSCNASIMQKPNMLRHKCGSPDRYEKCKICSLYFLACNIKRHVEQHSPKFIPKNISVEEFELLDNSVKLGKKRRRYSSDDDASTGADVSLSISKTYDTRKVVGRPYSDNLSEDSQDNVSDDDASIETPRTSNAYAKKYIKKSCIEKVDSDDETDTSRSKIEYSPGKRRDLCDTTLDMEKWRIDMKNKLFQCEKCYICFSHKQLLVNHISECENSSLSETPLICDQCDIVFHPSLMSFHEKLHELVRQNPIENYIYLINISTNGLNTNNDQRWLYKCQPCDVHYLNVRSLERHFSYNHVLSDCVRCEICNLQFTKKSRTRHVRIQHEEGDWSKDDLHLEIAHRKIVGIGEIHLTTYVKLKSHNEESSREIEEIAENKVKSTDGTVEIEDEKEIENNISKDESKKLDHNLYKCINCSKHYLTKLSLLDHIMEASHELKGLQCDLCGLLFEKRALVIHKSMQHEELKLGREDFVIITLTQNDETVDSEVLNDHHNRSEKSDSIIEANPSLKKENTVDLSEKIKEISKQLKSDASGPIDNHVYKCVECSVFYTNRRTLLLHIVIRKHQQFEFLKCDICGLVFGKGSLPKHKKVQHGKLNLTREDFIITDVFGSQLPDDENTNQSSIEHASSIDTDDLPLTGLVDKTIDNKETLKVECVKEKRIKIFKLYQCKDCKVCVEKTERNLHVCCSDIQKKHCIKCCLSFKNTDVIRHKRLHQKYRELSRKNFVLIRFGRRTAKDHKIYKCVTCSTHFVSLIALECHMNTLNHQTKRDFCKNCRLFFGKYCLSRHIYIHHNKLNLTIQQLNIIYVSEKDFNLHKIDGNKRETNNLSNSNNMSEPEVTPNINTVKKLFKCVECDVYFLTRASYYHHIYKHRKLDATEYIDCNICEFQFLTESLGVHMKSHKDKSFCLDKLLIEEYQPNNADSPKIEFYFAKDNLNSKLVSTTTPFDNDDENILSHTDEQLSVIDSTSDELPKTRTGEIDVEANPYSLNSNSSRDESTLNPIVQLSNSDVCINLTD